MKICISVLGLMLLCGVSALAQESSYESDCANECSFLTKDCTAYLECRIAKTTCMSDCMQRKVLEKVATALDKLTVVLEKQAKESDKKEETPKVLSEPPVELKPQEPRLGNMTY